MQVAAQTVGHGGSAARTLTWFTGGRAILLKSGIANDPAASVTPFGSSFVRMRCRFVETYLVKERVDLGQE
jgi:hypothetical protein